MIVIHWHGYPVCATRIDSLEEFKKIVKVFSEKPSVPFKAFERQKYPPIYIKNESDPAKFLKHEINNIELLIMTGWSHEKWNNFAKILKKRGVPIIMMVDNNLRYSLRQIVGAIYFRIFFRKLADYYLVAGNSSEKLLNFFGVSSSKIGHGYYGFTSKFFPYPKKNEKIKRKKNFVFIGQKIKRKGIDILLKAYFKYLSEGGEWGLRIIGSGKWSIPELESIKEQNFLQPLEISKLLQNNYVLVLPSRKEHWGTIAAEAAASGMILILSNSVGSKPDILKNGINGFSFTTGNVNELKNILLKFDNFSNSQLIEMSNNSIKLSRIFSERSFYNSINNLGDIFK